MKGLNTFIIFLLCTFFTVNAQNWQLKKDKDGVQVYTQSNPSSAFDLLKAECVINARLTEILNLIFDVDSHTAWVYNCVQSKLIKKNNLYDIVYYAETYAPWPVSNRDLVIHLKAITDSTNAQISIHGVSEPKLKGPVEGKIRVPRSIANWKLIPINQSTTRIIYTLDIDPGGSLPAWLVNFASVEGPYLSFQKMKALLIKND